MFPNRRIFLNIVATYGRSLFALVCGLFSARWVLEALGLEDFDLYGVVDGLVVFISVINMHSGCAEGGGFVCSLSENRKRCRNKEEKNLGFANCC